MNALLTDLYELNMATSYMRRGMTGTATFSLFVRSLPPARGFLVAAGIESCLDRIQDFRFEDDDIRYLRDTLRYEPRDLEAFRRLRFTGDIWAIPEGRIALAGEPILEVTAPLPEAQLIETLFLNLVTFETTIASKAARCVIAARGRDVIDFSFRRTQGIEAGIDVARLSNMVGFISTSNVEAARRHGLIAAGTMAHSYIEAFPTELEAFRAYAQDFPGRVTFLVDTYDTITGIKHAIATIKELGPSGRLGVRIDSGDLVALSKQGRKLLDAAGLPQVRIIASGALDEVSIDKLVRDGAKIDAFGVGTRMGVSADHPYLDTAYKLVSYDGRPVMKLSRGKVTAPGRKQVFRRAKPFGDLIGLHDEKVPAGREPLLEAVMVGGVRRSARPSIADSRALFKTDLGRLPAAARNIGAPRVPGARQTPALVALTLTTRKRLATHS
ncbi:MAG TPA: nicotinate phosphoribosyltransferase [Candidatus Dormibacteraeota bacterium]|nr:nicotinate phosphoribosyltransferase [Candidatus Dormibacteraeota bacterium]